MKAFCSSLAFGHDTPNFRHIAKKKRYHNLSSSVSCVKYHFASSIVSPSLNKIQKCLWQPRHKSNTAVPCLTLHIDNVDGNHIFTDLISSQGHQFANPRFQSIDIEFTF